MIIIRCSGMFHGYFLVLSTANSYISMKSDENSGSITFIFPSKDQHFTYLNFLKNKIWQKDFSLRASLIIHSLQLVTTVMKKLKPEHLS